MMFLINIFGTKLPKLFLMLSGEGKISFGVYDVERSLTPIGWAVIIILPIASILGAVYLIRKSSKNQN